MDLEKMQKKVAELEKEQEALKALAAQGNKPVTANATGAVAEGTKAAPITGRPAFEVLDTAKGKALGFAAAARCVAFSGKNYDEAMRLAKTSAVPFYGEGVLALVKAAFEEHSGQKALGESTLSGGGALNPDPLSAEFIEYLRPNVVFQNAPVTRVPMSTATLTFARQNGAATAAWLGESQSLNATAPTFDNISLVLKKAGALVAISNDLLRDNAIAADMIVRQDLVAQYARLIDLAYLRGTGTAYQPKGIRNQVSSTNVFSASAGSGANTLTTALADLWKADYLIRTANVPFTPAQAFWVMSPRTESGLAQLRDGVGRPFFAEEMAGGKLKGFSYFTTTQQPDNLSGGGSGGSVESEITLCIGNQILVGEGLAPQIQVAPQGAYYDGSAVQSGLSRDETAVAIVGRTDIVMRHTLAAAVVTGVTIGS